jgi:hypothetical protein
MYIKKNPRFFEAAVTVIFSGGGYKMEGVAQINIK